MHAGASDRSITLKRGANADSNAKNIEDGVLHEGGHNLAYRVWGSYTPPQYSDFYQAWEAEGGVTRYGSTNPAEGFADAYQMATNGNPTLNNYPRQKAAIERLRESVQ
jgi:hypothetical protein